MTSKTDITLITLTEPVKIDGKDVSEIKLRKPMVGELRGLSMSSILQMDITTLSTLFERITMPPMSPDQIAKLDPADFTEMGVKALLFFAKKNQLEGLGLN